VNKLRTSVIATSSQSEKLEKLTLATGHNHSVKTSWKKWQNFLQKIANFLPKVKWEKHFGRNGETSL